jgi:subfamily B ATP-binding cassette protein MsbA
VKKIKKILAKQFKTFHYFYSFLGYRIFLALILSICVGALDGLGLSMFLPLLQMAGGEAQANPEGMGNLGFLVEGIKALGFQLNLLIVLTFMLFFFILKGLFAFFAHSYKVFLQQRFIRNLRMNMVNA